jgi:hypothetical protein
VPFETVMLLDRRLAPISVENLAVTLIDGAVAVYGFSAMAELRDPTRAVYSARNYNEAASSGASMMSGKIDNVSRRQSSGLLPVKSTTPSPVRTTCHLWKLMLPGFASSTASATGVMSQFCTAMDLKVRDMPPV